MEPDLKNYYQNKPRRIVLGRMEVRPLSQSDLLILSLFTLPVILQLVLNFSMGFTTFNIGLLFFIAGFACMFTVTSPLGTRFRSVYFSLIWLTTSICLLLNTLTIAKAPLFSFLLYHIIRLLFWWKYEREFIPYEIGRGKMYRYVSKIEGRGGYKEDKFFMKILAWLGFAVFMYCFFGMVGTDVSTLK